MIFQPHGLVDPRGKRRRIIRVSDHETDLRVECQFQLPPHPLGDQPRPLIPEKAPVRLHRERDLDSRRVVGVPESIERKRLTIPPPSATEDPQAI